MAQLLLDIYTCVQNLSLILLLTASYYPPVQETEREINATGLYHAMHCSDNKYTQDTRTIIQAETAMSSFVFTACKSIYRWK